LNRKDRDEKDGGMGNFRVLEKNAECAAFSFRDYWGRGRYNAQSVFGALEH